MFANLFKPRWRHSDPEVRLSAVSKLCPDQPDQARILCQLALHDDNRQVRIVAVGRLSDTDSLLDVLSHSSDPEVREEAGLRVSECLNGEGSDSLSELLRRLDDADTRTQIIINVSSEQLQQSALNCIDDE
ncbi:MAG: HEAT repeat domain-containing protein, partial [Marinobacterium sp.]